MSFGKKLRLLREEKNLSQIELSKEMNVSSQALSQYELGKRMPDAEMIIRIADFFDVSIDYLLDRTDERITVDKIKAVMASDPEFARILDKLLTRKELQELYKIAKDMPAEKLKQYIRIIKAL
ncbi:MAG: helix-turn-helix transcriptional regulator [Halanaerobiaceae bacterium]|jgi:transcriptional regulator with XRE-family HTH domain|nr:helix-turn-helix transcriptional regulator [Halanaerobiaceae bacterium]